MPFTLTTRNKCGARGVSRKGSFAHSGDAMAPSTKSMPEGTAQSITALNFANVEFLLKASCRYRVETVMPQASGFELEHRSKTNLDGRLPRLPELRRTRESRHAHDGVRNKLAHLTQQDTQSRELNNLLPSWYSPGISTTSSGNSNPRSLAEYLSK